MFKAAVITVSDRSFRGERPDTSGPLVVELLQTAGYDVRTTLVVPDEQVRIEAALRSYCDEQPVDLIITTGGTGFSPRDMTPEATIAVCQRLTREFRKPCGISQYRLLPGVCSPGPKRVSGVGLSS